MNDFQSIITEATAEATAVLDAVFEKMKVKPPSQDVLREAFRKARQSEEGMMAFEQQYGTEVFTRQLELGIRRENG